MPAGTAGDSGAVTGGHGGGVAAGRIRRTRRESSPVWMARARDVFAAAFEIQHPDASTRTPRVLCRRLWPRRKKPPRRLAALPGDLPLVITGDGALRYRGRLAADLPRRGIDTAALNLAHGAVTIAARAYGAGRGSTCASAVVRAPARCRTRAGKRARGSPGRRADSAFESTARRLRPTSPRSRRCNARSFAHAWGAEAIRWELENTNVARMYVARDVRGRSGRRTARAGSSSTSCTSTVSRSTSASGGRASPGGSCDQVVRDAVAEGARMRHARGAPVERGRRGRCTRAWGSEWRVCGETTIRIRARTRLILWHRTSRSWQLGAEPGIAGPEPCGGSRSVALGCRAGAAGSRQGEARGSLIAKNRRRSMADSQLRLEDDAKAAALRGSQELQRLVSEHHELDERIRRLTTLRPT